MKTRFAKLCGILLLFPLLLRAETIVVKTKAPHNKQAVFQYRIPKGYDKSRREMYRVLVIFGGRFGSPRLGEILQEQRARAVQIRAGTGKSVV